MVCKVCGKKFLVIPSHESYRKHCSKECQKMGHRKVEWPTKKKLQQDIKNMSWLALGRKYKVSDNAVRKWARSYKLI